MQAEVKETKNAFVWKDQYKSLYTIPNAVPEESYKKSQLNKSVVPLARASVYGDKPIAFYAALMESSENVEELDRRRREAEARHQLNFQKAEATSATASPAEAAQSAVPQTPFVRCEKKVGRNEPCPCGSGKKYKSCHGKLG